jgi:hypothetical protein
MKPTVPIVTGRRHGISKIYALSIPAEAALLTVSGCVDLGLALAQWHLPDLQTGFLTGLQNAVLTRIAARTKTAYCFLMCNPKSRCTWFTGRG